MDEEERICGAHFVKLEDGRQLEQAVVVIMNGRVVNYYDFRDEIAMCEWMGGTIEVKRDEEDYLRAYWHGKILE